MIEYQIIDVEDDEELGVMEADEASTDVELLEDLESDDYIDVASECTLVPVGNAKFVLKRGKHLLTLTPLGPDDEDDEDDTEDDDEELDEDD